MQAANIVAVGLIFPVYNSDDELFKTEITAPENMKVAVAGENQAMSGSNAGMLQDEYSSDNGVRGIIAQLGDISLATSDVTYLPFDAATSGTVKIVVGGSKVSVPFVSQPDVKLPSAGKYSYTFVAQAFFE